MSHNIHKVSGIPFIIDCYITVDEFKNKPHYKIVDPEFDEIDWDSLDLAEPAVSVNEEQLEELSKKFEECFGEKLWDELWSVYFILDAETDEPIAILQDQSQFSHVGAPMELGIASWNKDNLQRLKDDLQLDESVQANGTLVYWC